VDLVRHDLPFERSGPVGLSPYGQTVWWSNDGVLRSTDDAKGSIPHKRMRLELVATLLVQVFGSLTEVEVLEWVTTSVGRCSISSVFRTFVIQDGGPHLPLVGFLEPQG